MVAEPAPIFPILPEEVTVPRESIGNCPGTILFVSPHKVLGFCDPVETVTAYRLEGVLPALRRIEQAVSQGWYAAGFLAFEAAPAFDEALVAHPPAEFPLVWFGLYKAVFELPRPAEGTCRFEVGSWRPLILKEAYCQAVQRIREYIRAGDAYQVNYTFRLSAPFRGDTLGWFNQLSRAQAASYCAFVNTGRFHVLSASPELFFQLEGNQIWTRPMKGTRPRGQWAEEDQRQARDLAESDKERAENVMIVDLLRNDLGRIAAVGSVAVPELFQVEQYPTVWQMTSTITAQTHAPVPEILAALFPSGSVTGAPKVRVMEIIRELEPFPREVYCGSVGWWFPHRRAGFNVAIRTVTVDLEVGAAHYGVGSGITWGSCPEKEYQECLLKARVLTHQEPDFELLESILFDGSYFLLEEHLDRLEASASYFGFRVDRDAAESALIGAAKGFDAGTLPVKVRLLVARDGSWRIESEPIKSCRQVRLGLAREPVDCEDRFLYHKTTHRAAYEAALRSRPDCEDVLLYNSNGEITESTIANVVVEINGQLLTPPVACGLLSGTFRKHLVETGVLREATIKKSDLSRAQSIRLINSVRKWIDTLFLPQP